MEILENLPSIPSSIFSGKDITLFDKYRDKYRRFTREVKAILDSATLTIEYDKIWDGFKQDHRVLDYIINSHSIPSCWDHNTEYSWNEIQTTSRYFVPSYNLNPLRCWNSAITAFYIPENITQFNVYITFLNRENRSVEKEVLIGQYERTENKINGIRPTEDILEDWKINSDLENILKRSKELPSLFGEDKLKNILSDSKKRLVIRNNCREKTVILRGEEYRRIVLFQPVLYLSIFYAGVEIIGKFSTDGEGEDRNLTLFYTEINTLTFEQINEISKGENVYIGKIKDRYILYQFKDRKFIELS